MEAKKFSFVGPSCGHHAAYTFYKAIRYQKNGRNRILSLGEFFFVKIWADSDLVSIGELQLLWEDKNTNQVLSSMRLYFLPEYTPEGRVVGAHGEDEVIAVSEKAVLHVSDLLDWIADPKEVNWDRGLTGVCTTDCDPTIDSPALTNRFSPAHSDFLADVWQEKEAIGDVPDLNELRVLILSFSQYGRYRALLKRLTGVEHRWMHSSLVAALGGFTVKTKRTHVLFCRDHFDYPELEEHPFLCNHLAPKLKGRPRKKKKLKRAGSPESESASSESSASTSASLSAQSKVNYAIKNGIKKDLLSILSQKNTKEELDFLKKLISFMERRNTPIERPPMLGFKQIDLHLFYQKVDKFGGYEGCMGRKKWKAIYDELGGNPQNTSAATCTRRHYEKFLLPFEKHLRGCDDGGTTSAKSKSAASSPPDSDKESNTPPVDGKDDEENADDDEDAQGVKGKSKRNGDVEEEEGGHKAAPQAEDDAAVSGNILLAPGLQSLVGNKPDSQVKIDSDGKRLQIDDLIIIPNHLSSPPEGGSALQSLAKIASRYQTGGGGRDRRRSGDASRPAADSSKGGGAIVQPLPPTNGAKKQQQQQQQQPGNGNNLFSLLPPGLLPSLPLPGVSSSPGLPARTDSPASSTGSMKAGVLPGALGALALPDPAKLGAEGYNLLQYYEKHLKAVAAGQQQQQRPAAKDATSAASAATKKESKDRDRSKVSKPPLENKRPPSLMQTPCAFVQTSTFYTNPLSEIAKLKEVNSSTTGLNASSSHGDEILDLSSCKRPKLEPCLPGEGGGGFALNLKKEALAMSSSSSLDLSVKREGGGLAAMSSSPSAVKNELKASPFSAEALLSKPSKHPQDLVKVAPMSSLEDPRRSGKSPVSGQHHRAGTAPSPLADRSSDRSSSSARASPWHTPVSHSSPVAGLVASKPAIPVSPVVREDKQRDQLSASAALLGLLPPTSSMGATPSVGTPPISLALPPTSFSLPSTSFSHHSLAANPYLALLSPSASSLGKAPMSAASAGAAAAAAAAAAGYPAHLMDPATSAYYAALYSQQMYGAAGLSPYASLSAGLRPGLAPPSGLDPLQASLQAMLRGSSSAANPYAAAYAGLSGLHYPGFPPQPPRKDS